MLTRSGEGRELCLIPISEANTTILKKQQVFIRMKTTLCTVGKNVRRYNCYGKEWIIKNESPYDSAVHSGHITKELEAGSQRNIWIIMYTAALFIVAKM